MLEKTELGTVKITEGLWLGSRTSRIDGVEHILTTEGSEGDNQPVRKAGLSALAGKLSPSTTRAEVFYAKDGEGSQFQESRDEGLFIGERRNGRAHTTD